MKTSPRKTFTMEKEPNFISAVIYLDTADKLPSPVADQLIKALEEHFVCYEIVLVADGIECRGLRSSSENCGTSDAQDHETVVVMSKRQGLEKAMNAGIDCAVGDYIVEIDDLGSFNPSFIWEAYQIAMQGHDVVFGESNRKSLKGTLFYPLFNRFSGADGKLTTGSCRLVSRRAVNRVRSMSDFMPYRKAAYAASGLSVTSLLADSGNRINHKADVNLAIDSLALYTDLFYKVSVWFAIILAFFAVLEMIYAIAIFAAGTPVQGWSTLMFVLTFGLFGLFVLLACAIKYLSLLVKAQYNGQYYLIEEIRRL